MLSIPGICWLSFTIMKAPFEEFVAEFNQKNKCAPYIYQVQPFPHAVYKNVGSALESIKKQMDKLQYEERFTDLYNMYQTKEILTKDVCDCIMGIIPMVKSASFEVTGLYLSSQIYEKHSYLLCHDDQLEDRLFAFVFYIHTKDDVSVGDGGTLDLFRANILQEPDEIVTRIIPQTYSLALFEVSPRSFHQVAEVVNGNFVRRSIGGWVRGRYKCSEIALQETDFSLLKQSIEQVALDSLSDYFTLDSKHKILEKTLPFECLPVQYYFVEVFFFDDTSFSLITRLDSQFDYYAYSLTLPKNRFLDCTLKSDFEGFYKLEPSRQNGGRNIRINPGKGAFFMLKFARR